MHRKQSLLIAEALGKFIKGVIDQPIRAILQIKINNGRTKWIVFLVIVERERQGS